MSEFEHDLRPNRRSSDFSIARILADNPKKLSPSQRSHLKPSHAFSVDSITLLDSAGDQKLCPERANNLNDDKPTTSEFVDRSIVHLPSTSGLFHVMEVEQTSDKSPSSSSVGDYSASNLYWLQCTRYRPPKIPRKPFGGKISRRKPATYPRIPFTALELEVLEKKYKQNAYLSRKDVMLLSSTLRLPHSRIKIWFQNRRARDRRETKVPSITPVLKDS